VAALSRRAAIAAAVLATLAAAHSALAAPGVAGPEDMSLGNPKAKVTVVEYASASCPHCAHFNAEVFPAFKTTYVDTGKVRYTLKEFLTAPAQVAAAGFLMARCAGPSKYFTVLDQVFRSQPAWSSGSIKATFLDIAQKNGLTEAQFEACLKDEAALDKLNARVKAAVDDGVDSTPTFYVNGVKVENVATLADLDAAIAKASQPAKGAKAAKGGRR
jgi:protein-disulfide isomerase